MYVVGVGGPGMSAIAQVLAEMHQALLAICDPEAVDRQAQADQARLIESYGGPDAAHQLGSSTSTPVKMQAVA